MAAIAGAREAATQFSKNTSPEPPKVGENEGNEKLVSTRTRTKSKEWVQVQRPGGDAPGSSFATKGV